MTEFNWHTEETLTFIEQLCKDSKINSRIRSKADNEDVKSEVYRRLTAAAKKDIGFSQIKNQDELQAYIRTVFDSAIMEEHRKHLKTQRRDVKKEIQENQAQSNIPQDSSSGFGNNFVAGHTSPSMGAAKREELEQLAEARKQLTANENSVLQMDLEGKTFKVMAETLNSTETTGRRWLMQAKVKLQNRMNKSKLE